MVLTLILGGMFAGKTTELLKHRFGKTLIISHTFDTRGEGVKTHDGVQVAAMKCSVLPKLSGYDTVLIDEAQFFDSLEGVETLAPNVVVAGLSGDYQKKPFGKILELIPKADNVTFLKARCDCGEPAAFTKRISGDTCLISIESTYEPKCGNCF